MPTPSGFDEIGYWSEIKLDILKDYAAAYSRILAAQQNPSFYHIYIDAFAGAGMNISRSSQEFVLGSPLNALAVKAPFREYHFVELEPTKFNVLRQLIGDRRDVHLHEGYCNQILVRDVFPKILFSQYRRGLCILDTYGLHLNWEVMRTAGQMKTIDLFLNFPVADMNRNVLWRDPQGAPAEQVKRMGAFWGDDSWRVAAYTTKGTLFGYPEKETNQVVAEAFRRRLRDVAGFERVPEPLPMKNSRGAIIYHLFLPHKKTSPRTSCLIFFANIGRGEGCHGNPILHRMDRRDLESDQGLHENQPGLQALLCGTVRRAIPRGDRASL
jgi:three-Cys-motif partner protein